ncbi:hypothetical protein R3P38DRAFT_3354402 [Favolaschia claudopus]|uniref:PUM-HD domain-containing protein n=1 Tax=Favolaschia claudopus TaxID=2862362 RepID=A0AAW0BR04_9AGAR
MYDHSSPPRQQPPPSVAPPPPTSSIWAPQPLAGDTAWPRGIEAFSRSPLTPRRSLRFFGAWGDWGWAWTRRTALPHPHLNSPEPMLAASLSRGGLPGRRLSAAGGAPVAVTAAMAAAAAERSNSSPSASAGNMSSCSGLGAKVDGDVDGVGGLGSLSMVDTSTTSETCPSRLSPSLTNSDSNNSATVSAPLSTAVAPTAASNNLNANNNNGDAEDANEFVYPQSPDFSPLSISSVLLTPLDSPRGLWAGAWGITFVPDSDGGAFAHSQWGVVGSSSRRPSMPSPIGHPPGMMHSPMGMGQGQGMYSPTHGHGLMHSPPGVGAMFKERERAPTYEPVSPFAPVQELVGVGHERLQTLGGGNGNGGVGFGLGSGFPNNKDAFGMGINAHAHAHTRTHTHTHNHANGSSSIPTSTVNTPLLGGVGGGNGNGGVNSTPRFVSLPSTPLQMPSSFGFDFVGAGGGGGGGGGAGAGGIEGQGHQLPYYQHQHQHARGMSAGAIGLEGGGALGMGLDYRSDWLRAEDGMGMGMGMQGLGQEGAGAYRLGLGLGSGMGLGAQQQQRGLGLGFAQREGGAAAGQGMGSLYAGEEVGMSPRGSASLGGSAFGYQQQQQLEQAQQHLRVQRLVQQQQQAQRQPQQDPFGALWDLRGGSEGGILGGGGGVGASAGTVGDTGGGASLGGGHGQGHGHGHGHAREGRSASAGGHEPINFLSLLHPASSPPYAAFVARIIKSADQQASIFLQQKLKVAGSEERARIVDAICARGGEMMMHRFGNWAVQRCLEAATGPEERRKIVACMRGRIVDLATNCYGCHVLQKALDCEEEEVRLLIVSELLMGDPAQTLVNKHASHVWSKIMELSWTPPAPPIFAYVNKSLKGKWAALACHETGSLVVQHAFENLEETAKDGIVDELLGQGIAVFGEVAKSQWGSYCIQHILEHGSEKHRQMALDHLLTGLLEFATNEQGSKSVVKALKEGGKETLDRVVQRMCEPAKGYAPDTLLLLPPSSSYPSARRAMIVDLALSLTGSQLIASVLPTADKDQRALLYDCIRGHIVTLRGCKTGSKVIWLFWHRISASYERNDQNNLPHSTRKTENLIAGPYLAQHNAGDSSQLTRIAFTYQSFSSHRIALQASLFANIE